MSPLLRDNHSGFCLARLSESAAVGIRLEVLYVGISARQMNTGLPRNTESIGKVLNCEVGF